MNYLPFEAGFAATLRDPTLGYISRYALGRDYHKLLRNRLKQLGAHRAALRGAGLAPLRRLGPILER